MGKDETNGKHIIKRTDSILHVIPCVQCITTHVFGRKLECIDSHSCVLLHARIQARSKWRLPSSV